MSRAGVTFTGFQSRPDGFVAAPSNVGGANDAYIRDVLHRFEVFFRQVLSGERSRSQWLNGDVYLKVAPKGSRSIPSTTTNSGEPLELGEVPAD